MRSLFLLATVLSVDADLKEPEFDPRSDTLNNALNEPRWTILDVRDEDELIRDGNLRDMGAENWVNVPLNELEEALELSPEEFEDKYGAEKFKENYFIVVHCMGGYRSVLAVPIMLKAGYKVL